MSDDEPTLPRNFPGGYVPVIGNVIDDGSVELTAELPRTNGGTAENSMRRFSDVFPYTGPEVNVVVRRKRRRRR
ncbi:MAG: hypothetical protein ACK4YQ_17010 [Phenylobacterium sp.]|uniref:hypothetical protein n=1 Tax=Phenylobacterium sp. TaxID=1871053 RepID=UPI0039191848